MFALPCSTEFLNTFDPKSLRKFSITKGTVSPGIEV
jgi:hypothetical protein